MRVYQLTHCSFTLLFSQTPKYKASKSQHQMQFGEKFSDVQTFGFGKLEDDPGSQRLSGFNLYVPNPLKIIGLRKVNQKYCLKI